MSMKYLTLSRSLPNRNNMGFVTTIKFIDGKADISTVFLHDLNGMSEEQVREYCKENNIEISDSYKEEKK